MNNEKVTSKFTCSRNKGFRMGFANGLVISVQWGSMNYCDRRSIDADPRTEMNQETVQSETAEIAIWNLDSDWFNFGSDEVKGWCTANEVADWISMVAAAEDLADLHSIATERNYIGI